MSSLMRNVGQGSRQQDLQGEFKTNLQIQILKEELTNYKLSSVYLYQRTSVLSRNSTSYGSNKE
jgi:hypothetical protein